MVRKSYEEVKERIESENNNKLLSKEYINNSKPLEIRCGCGEIFHTSFATYTNKRKICCDKCSKERYTEKRKTSCEEIKKMIEIDTNNEYTLLDVFWKNKKDGNRVQRLKVRHNLCNCEYEVNMGNWKSGKRCRKCGFAKLSNNARLTFEECKNKVESYNNGEFSLLKVVYKDVKKEKVVYERKKTYFLIKHNSCGHEFYRTNGNWNSYKSCPKCMGMKQLSKLHITMSIIAKHLYPNSENEYDIGFKGDNGGVSKYDLFIPSYKGKNTLFEFQSRFHDGKEDFDERKKNFAIENGYDIIQIDHRNVKIQDVVKQYFNLDYIPDYVNKEFHIYNLKKFR